MSESLRIVLADDSSVIRRLLSDTLSSEPDIEVVGTARNGQEALALIKTLRPDLILLDVDMPVMNGIQTVRHIRFTDKHTPILMFSTITVHGGEATLEALACGANDFIPKPSGAGHVHEAVRYVREKLVPRIRACSSLSSRGSLQEPAANPFAAPAAASSALAQRNVASPAITASVAAAAAKTTPLPNRAIAPMPVEVVVIGTSTGGPNALAQLFQALPGNLNVPILIVQHMPPMFTRLLAERLDRDSRLTVREGVADAVLHPNEVWVAPGDHHMTVKRIGASIRLGICQSPPENSCRPAVDVLFRSVAEVYGPNALGVILTGMGKDGLVGSQAMSSRGARIVAQDEKSCVVWGMPRAVAEAGIADGIIPLSHMAAEITTRVTAGQRQSQRTKVLT